MNSNTGHLRISLLCLWVSCYIKPLLYKHENVSLDIQVLCQKLGTVSYAWHISTGEVETGGSLRLEACAFRQMCHIQVWWETWNTILGDIWFLLLASTCLCTYLYIPTVPIHWLYYEFFYITRFERHQYKFYPLLFVLTNAEPYFFLFKIFHRIHTFENHLWNTVII